jgi:hypothetical protein
MKRRSAVIVAGPMGSLLWVPIFDTPVVSVLWFPVWAPTIGCSIASRLKVPAAPARPIQVPPNLSTSAL